MVRQIMEGRYDFDDDKWKEDKISQYARDLISKILVLDTQRRLTVDQCLSHEFFFPLVRRMSNTSERLKQPPSRYCQPLPRVSHPLFKIIYIQLQPEEKVDPGDQSSSVCHQIEETEGVPGEAESEGGCQLAIQDAAIQKGP